MSGCFDAVVLSPGLPDHTHEPTLGALRLRDDQVIIGPSSAEAAVRRAGKAGNFRKLGHFQSMRLKDVNLEALPGALVGPPWQARENALLATAGGTSLLYEPHGDFNDDDLLRGLNVDVLIAPATTQRLAGFFDLVKGNTLRKTASLLGVHTVIDRPTQRRRRRHRPPRALRRRDKTPHTTTITATPFPHHTP